MSAARGILEMSAFDRDDAGALDAESLALIERRDRVLGPGSPLFYKQPIHVTRAAGVWMFDAKGNRYLDAYNNVPSVGHCHPHVVEAVCRQVAALNTHTRYLHEGIIAYAERLLATFPPAIGNVAFTCTGSESVELALRIARGFTGGTAIVVSENAYHGNSTAASAISPSSGPGVPIGVDVRTVAPPDGYRFGVADPGPGFVARVGEAIHAIRRHGMRFAGMICDTVFSSDGIFTEPPGYLAEVAAVVREAGGLFIADEVQPGFCRTGGSWWGFQRHGVVPDLVVMGKPMGNGWPIAAVAVRPEIFEGFGRTAGYFNTFGGNPVAAAAGMAVLDVIEQEHLAENATRVGEHLRAGLRALARHWPAIADVRGVGLYTGVEFSLDHDPARPLPDLARAVVEGLRARRILIGTAGRWGNVLKIRPPLCFSIENADLLLQGLDGALRRALHEVMPARQGTAPPAARSRR
jgi:4-aminobutyrate aminotransferase-like enzyme